jgi:hypothetical protein
LCITVWRDTAIGKEGKEQNEYVCKFCCSLMCRIIFRISIRARNFCSSLKCLKDGSRDTKKHLSSSTSVLFFLSVAKSAVVVTHRKFRFVCFRACRGRSFSSSCELFASFSSSFLLVLKLLCVSLSSRYGRRNNNWSKCRYLHPFLLPSPDVAFFGASNSILKQVLRDFHSSSPPCEAADSSSLSLWLVPAFCGHPVSCILPVGASMIHVPCLIAPIAGHSLLLVRHQNSVPGQCYVGEYIFY